MEFCDILRGLLEERGVTQKQFALDLQIAPSTAGGYVQGASEPDFEMLRRIARYFGVSTDYLLDLHTVQAGSHSEEELLAVFRAMPPTQQAVYLEQGRVVLRLGQNGGA